MRPRTRLRASATATTAAITVVCVVSALAGLAGLAGCGQTSRSERDGTLTWFMWSGSTAEVDAWKHVAAMVTERYPNIHVRFQTASFDDYFTKLVTRAASGSLPCIISMQAERSEDIGELFRPIDDLMARNGIRARDFDPSILAGLSYAGKHRALPYDLGPYVVYYNRTMFERAGLPEPKPGWTLDEFARDARALTGKGKYGFVTDAYPDRWFPFAAGMGAPYRKGETLDLDNPLLVKAFGWTTDLVRTRHVSMPVPATSVGTWPLDQWRSGNAAMVVDGPWDLINAQQTVDFRIGIAPIPSTQGNPTALTTGSGFGVSRDCPNPEAAFEAITVLTGPKAEEYLADAGRAFPARTAQQKFWYAHAVPGAKPALEAALAGAQAYRTAKGWDHTSTILRQYGVEAFSGAESPGHVLRTVQSQVAPP